MTLPFKNNFYYIKCDGVQNWTSARLLVQEKTAITKIKMMIIRKTTTGNSLLNRLNAK